MTGTTAERGHRRMFYMQALSDDELLDVHVKTLSAAKRNAVAAPADLFPDAEFDDWKEWSLAIEAELDRRDLDHRKANL